MGAPPTLSPSRAVCSRVSWAEQGFDVVRAARGRRRTAGRVVAATADRLDVVVWRIAAAATVDVHLARRLAAAFACRRLLNLRAFDGAEDQRTVERASVHHVLN